MLPKSFGFAPLYPSEPIEGVWKGNTQFGRWLAKPSVCHIQADQSNLLLHDSNMASLLYLVYFNFIFIRFFLIECLKDLF